jgi:hypothetical protein
MKHRKSSFKVHDSPLLKKVGNKILEAFSPVKFESPALKKQRKVAEVKAKRSKKQITYRDEDTDSSEASVFIVDDESDFED